MTSLYFYTLERSSSLQSRVAYGAASKAGKFTMDLQRSALGISRFVPRFGEWSTPFPTAVEPHCIMPTLDAGFAMSFADVADAKAQEVKAAIAQGGKFALMYSGGIDSTAILCSLLKHLTADELRSVAIVANQFSIAEYPLMWNKFIDGKLTVLDADTVHYDELIRRGYTPITGDNGDCLFGTVVGIHFINRYFNGIVPEGHYSRYKAQLIDFFANPVSAVENYGELLYAKIDRAAQTAIVPIESVHDLFWWIIFDPKYVNCSLRGAVYFQDTMNIGAALDKIENWYNDVRFQQWSMVNNGTGEKIGATTHTYKVAARRYILDVTGDMDYFLTKEKIPSLGNVRQRRDQLGADAVDTNYRRMSQLEAGDRNFLLDCLARYEFDWL